MTARLLIRTAAACAGAGAVAAIVGLRPSAQQPVPVVRSHLVWFDRSGKRLDTLGELADYGNIELSPDGRRVAVAIVDAAVGTRDLWIYDVDGPGRTRLTASPADENWLIWAPDGKTVVFNAFSRTGAELRRSMPEAGARVETLLTDQEGVWPVSWSVDGRYLLYVRNSQRTGNDVWVLPLSGDRKPYPLLETDASENWAAFSPDGRWIAYSHAESTRSQPEVFVMAFAPGASSARKWRISADGGTQARWRGDGREIVYLAPDRRLMAAAVNPHGTDFDIVGIDPLFEIRLPYAPYHAFDVSADGRRFLVNTLVVGPGGETRIAGTPGSPQRR